MSKASYHRAWLGFYYLIARWLPPSDTIAGKIWRSIRARVAQAVFKQCGRDVNLEQGAIFGSGQLISIGDRSGIGVHARLQGRISIGNDVMMGRDVLIFTRNHAFDRTDQPMRLQGYVTDEAVTIEDDVWIGSRAIILPGVTLRHGTIVGAGAVVTKSTVPFAVVVGNPAQSVRRRNQDFSVDPRE